MEIEDIELSFTTTKKTYNYINLKDKTHYRHPNGYKLENKDLKLNIFLPMTNEEMLWAIKYYLPKLGE
jgi:hypothetical protein